MNLKTTRKYKKIREEAKKTTRKGSKGSTEEHRRELMKNQTKQVTYAS